MKLFSCTNSQCKSNVPFDAATNRVVQRITSDHPMNKEGVVDIESEAKVVNIEYVCGRCGSKVKEVPLKRVMRIKIEKVQKDFVFGIFQNKLRNGTYEFEIDKNNKKLNVKGIDLLPVEKEFILDKYKEQYIGGIKAEIVDTDGKGRYEVQVFNPNEVESQITIIVENGKAIDYYGDRQPYKSEREKAELAVSQTHY